MCGHPNSEIVGSFSINTVRYTSIYMCVCEQVHDCVCTHKHMAVGKGKLPRRRKGRRFLATEGSN